MNATSGETTMWKVQFFSLSGTFHVIKTEEFTSEAAAMQAISAYITPTGFSHLTTIDDDDDYGQLRVTARTPGGREGRNVATIEIPWKEGQY